MGMDYSKLTAVVDSASAPAVKKGSKISDAAKKSVAKKGVDKKNPKASEEKSTIKDSLMKKTALRKYNAFKISDAYKNSKKRIKDALEDTETTEDAVAVGVNALADTPADQVIAAVIETLGEAIDMLQEECPECGAEEEAPKAEEEEVKDSLNVTVTNGSGESVEVSTEGGDSVVSAPEMPAPEPAMEEPAIEEPAIEEGIGDSVEDDINAEQDALTGPQGKIMKLIKEGKFEEAQALLNKNEKRLSGLGK